MRILVFAHDSSLFGASQSLITILNHLNRKSDRDFLVILPYSGKIEEYLTSDLINYKVIPFPRCVIQEKGLFERVKARFRYQRQFRGIFQDLNEIINSFRPDVIYTNTSVVSVGQLLSKKYGIPHVWHIREFGDLDYDFKYIPSRSAIKNKLRSSSRLIFGSAALQSYWMEKERTNSCVIYNGIIENEYSLPEKKYRKCITNLAIIGAITRGKGQHLAIEALSFLSKDFQNPSLHIYGTVLDEKYHLYLLKLIEKYQLKNKVHFHGFIKEKEDIYSDMDIVLSCSRMEGFGRTIIESMGYGVPVVANASGGVLEIIENGENGLLFNESVEDLVLAVKKLKDNSLYNKISLNGWHCVVEKYTTKRYIMEIDETFTRAVEI